MTKLASDIKNNKFEDQQSKTNKNMCKDTKTKSKLYSRYKKNTKMCYLV